MKLSDQAYILQICHYFKEGILYIKKVNHFFNCIAYGNERVLYFPFVHAFYFYTVLYI